MSGNGEQLSGTEQLDQNRLILGNRIYSVIADPLLELFLTTHCKSRFIITAFILDYNCIIINCIRECYKCITNLAKTYKHHHCCFTLLFLSCIVLVTVLNK